jgi:hypothetical protein
VERYLWTVSVFDEHQVAAGRTGGLADARKQSEMALANHIANLVRSNLL